MESLSICSRSPSTMLLRLVTFAQKNSNELLATIPASARCVSVTSTDGVPHTQWRIERTDGHSSLVVVRGLRTAHISYFMTPVIDNGHLFVMAPAGADATISCDVTFGNTAFRMSGHDGSLIKLSPCTSGVSPMKIVVAVFAAMLLLTVVCAVAL